MPSSPGAVHRRTTEVRLTEETTTSLIVAGGVVSLASAVTGTESACTAVRPPLSVTVSVAGYRPATPYAWAAMRPLPVPPSPKFQTYEAIVPSGSYEDDPLNVTVWSACGAEGEKTEDATGGRFPAAPGTADGLFDGVIAPAVAYRKSYHVALPVVPSSPGAVHWSVTKDWFTEVTRKSATTAGGVVSFGGGGGGGGGGVPPGG